MRKVPTKTISQFEAAQQLSQFLAQGRNLEVYGADPNFAKAFIICLVQGPQSAEMQELLGAVGGGVGGADPVRDAIEIVMGGRRLG